jgi:hypothetical protein
MGMSASLMALLILVDSSDPSAPKLSISEDASGAFEARGELTLGMAVPIATAWQVLTDYERLPAFVPGLKSSRARASLGPCLLVDQEAQVRVLIVSREVHVVLCVEEALHRTITFHDLAHQDFDRYEGGWALEETAQGLVVHYHLLAKPRFWVPAPLAKGLVKRQARDLLRSVQDELLRRSASP